MGLVLVDHPLITTYSDQYVDEIVYEKLIRVANKYPLILFEGYRSLEKQIKMFNEFKKEHPAMSDEEVHEFIAMPSKAVHCTGGAIDVAIKGLDFGTDYLCFDGRQATDYYINEEVKKNRQLLCKLLDEEGFWNFYNEWWHFEIIAITNGGA